jgi:hypothetical protein
MTEFTALQRRRMRRWVRLISAEWQKPVHSIINTGRLLIRAHEDLITVHGAWSAVVRDDLPFNRKTAHKLMSLAKNPVLSDVSHERHLPPHWTTLFALDQVDHAALLILIRRGVVNPQTQRHEAEQMQLLTPAEAETFELAIPIPDYNRLEDAARSLRYGLDKFIEAVNDRLNSDDPMTEAELELVAATVRDAIRDLNGIGIGVRPMRTINGPPRLEDRRDER